MKTITFNTRGHDGFIDFIKFYAIICVLFGHTFLWLDKVAYYTWAGMQVPLFILIQAFHFYKKNEPSFKLGKALKRVMIPFLIVEFITIFVAYIFCLCDVKVLINSMLYGGGYGAGTYYPWVYIQIAAFLPLTLIFVNLINKKDICKQTLFILVLLLCEGFEILFSLFSFPDWLYRLLAIRYLFLLYLGWLWVKEGIRINLSTIILAIVSLLSIVYFEYFSINDEPWFFNTSWTTHRWPCYFFVSYGLVPILYYFWCLIKKNDRNDRIKSIVKTIAASTYEIFLVQMSIIVLIRMDYMISLFGKTIGYLIWVVLIWLVSLFGGFSLNRIINKIFIH